MKKKQSMLPQDFYYEYLSNIHNIHFTKREIDVMSCLSNARKTSKIASFLSIDPRTVETHVRNIMSKIECNSRERIIDFIESSEKLPHIRQYYSILRINAIFEQNLKNISFLHPKEITIWISNKYKNEDTAIHHFASHLKLAGIKVSDSTREKKASYAICFLPKFPEEEIYLFFQKISQNINRIFCLLSPDTSYTNVPKNLINFKKIDLVRQENYYFAFFTILKKILPNVNLDKFINEFVEQEKKIFSQDQLPQIPLGSKKLDKVLIKTYFLSFLFAIGLISSILFVFQSDKKNHKRFHSQPGLIIPKESVFLNRSELIGQIDNKLKGKSDIQSVGLIGIGGAGKTTLARQYAHSQKLSLVWELNAETKNNLLRSFENLAHAVAQTEKEERILKELQKIKDTEEKERKLFLFIKEKLRNHPNWLLIYDNVEIFTDIRSYFPTNNHEWGKGKVILTSRNRNIENNIQINEIIYITGLNQKEKESLFFRITGNNGTKKISNTELTKIKSFLTEIPSFPLDILIAAYYLKATHVTYDKYVKQLKDLNHDFVATQEYLLKENSEYSKTRYGIITLSLKQLIQSNPIYKEILLFLCLIGSQGIPKDLLSGYKNDAIIDNFIIHLKKYSLIEIESSSLGDTTLSIHRSTQLIILNYLLKELPSINIDQILHQIITCLEKYIDKEIRNEHLPRIKRLVSHGEALLNKDFIFKKISIDKIRADLSYLYYLLGNLQAAQSLLIKNETILLGKKDNYSIAFARTLSYLGIIYWNIGNFDKSLNLLNKSKSIYNNINTIDYQGLCTTLNYLGTLYFDLRQNEKAITSYKEALIIINKYLPDNYIEKAFILSSLGLAYQTVNLKIAREYLEESINIYKKSSAMNHVKYAWALSELACYYRAIGKYQEAMTLHKQVLDIYKDYYAEDSLNIAWAMRNLGMTYCALGDLKKAKMLLDKSHNIFKDHLGNNNIKTKWCLFQLGEVYKKLGDLKKAKNIFKDCLIYYEEYYGSNNNNTANILRSLGQVLFLEEDLQEAQYHFEKALLIYLNDNNILAFCCYEDLAEIYLQKSKMSSQSQKDLLKEQTVTYLTKALEILEKYYPIDSSHLTRVKIKLDNIK